MGARERNSRNNRYARKLTDDRLDKVAKPKTSTGKMTVVPFASVVLTCLLAAGVAWVQAQSKDLLPNYTMAPAIIGVVLAAVTAVLSVIGYFQLRSGDGFHKKAEKEHARSQRRRDPGEPLDPSTLKHQSHPIYMYHWALFGDSVAMVVCVGSYLYMLLCLVLSDGEFCVAYAPGTTKEECKVKGNGGTIVVLLLFVMTIGTAVLLFAYHEIVKDSLDYFDYRHQRLVRRSESGRGQQQARTRRQNSGGPPRYDDLYDQDRRDQRETTESGTDDSALNEEDPYTVRVKKTTHVFSSGRW